MALNDIVFQKQNGGMGRTAPSADPISGLLMVLGNEMETQLDKTFDPVGEGTAKIFVAKLNYYEQLSAQFGITETEVPVVEEKEQTSTNNEDEDNEQDNVPKELTEEQKQMNTIVYHVREFFRMSPAGTLYLAVKTGGDILGEDIKALQYFSGGEIRQVGVFTATIQAELYQDACTGDGVETGLFDEHQPLSVIATQAKGDTTLAYYADEAESRVKKDRSNVSILISRDCDPELDEKLGTWAEYGCIGTVLGALSNAMVHESIAWVKKFPLGLQVPGFITGEQLNKVSTATLKLINKNRYLFVRTHVGDAGNYLNDSHTLDESTSDYAYIENVRTMDKATRGIRTNLLPHLNAPLYVDPATGNLRPDMVTFFELVAGRALEDMEKAGELSGYKAVIDPAQNVLATSTLEIQIKNVPVGVMRKVIVKIGYTTKL